MKSSLQDPAVDFFTFSHGLGFCCCCCCCTFELVGMTVGLGCIIFWSDGFKGLRSVLDRFPASLGKQVGQGN